MSRFGEGHGKPSELHPRSVAKALRLVTDGPTTWGSLLDAACNAYWQKRVENPGDNLCGAVENARPTLRKARDGKGSERESLHNPARVHAAGGGEAA